MKKLLYIIALCALFASCEKPEEPIVDEALALTASADSVVCEPQLGDVTALQLEWTAGTNRGTGSAISYTLDMSIDGVSDAPVQFVIGRTSDRTLTWSHIQLSDTLCKYFPKMEEKKFYTCTLRMRALVQMTDEEQVSEPVHIVIARNPSVLGLLLQSDSVSCFPSMNDQIAWQIRWTPADNHGVEQEIIYTVDIDKDSTFTAGVHFTLDSAYRALELSHADLTKMIDQSFPEMNENRFYTLYLRVRAKIAQSNEEQFSSAVGVQVCRYANEVSPLLMVGDAAPNGWDKDRATPMPLDENDPNRHVWQGTLQKGEFKFLVSKQDWFPCYVCNYDAPTQMVCRENDNDGYYDFKWVVPATGEYRIEADTKQMTIAIIPVGEGMHLYLIGDATPVGWEREKALQMDRDENNPNMHTWQGLLKEGEFKMLTSTEDWYPCYVKNGADETKMEYCEHEGDQMDFKWYIKTPGEYRIEADIKLNMISITYVAGDGSLYLVGDATPNGWDKDHATLMNRDAEHPNIHTWQGDLKRGEFKMLTSLKDWNPCYVRDKDDASKMVYRENDEAYEDLKWYVSTAGEYRITANTEAMTILIEYLTQEEHSHIYMIGDATPGGWSWDDITEMDHPQAHIFTYEGTLKAGDLKFPTEIKTDWSGTMIYAPRPDCVPVLQDEYDEHAGSPDNKWKIPAEGIWRIKIDTQNKTISFKQL